MAASNEIKQGIHVTDGNKARTVVDTLTDAVASITEVATTQQEAFGKAQAGFEQANQLNDKTIEALNTLAEAMVIFTRDGKIGTEGQTGGAAAYGVTSSDKMESIMQEVVSRELDSATDNIVDEVKDEGRKTREKVEKSAEETRDELTKSIKKEFQEQRNEIDSISNFIKKMSGNGDASSKIDSVGNLLNNFMDGPEGAKFIGKIKNVAGAVGLATTVGTTFVNAVGGGKQILYDADQRSLNQTGEKGNYGITLGMDIDKQALAYSTGMKESSVQDIQSALVKYGADYGSNSYKEGLNFAISAQTEYGVDYKTATDLYTKTVLRGNMALTDLNATMDSLNETVQNSGISMQEAVQDFQDSIKDFSAFAASDTLANEYAIDLQQFSGDSDLMQHGGVSSIAAIAAAYSGDVATNAKATEYESQGYSTGTATAMAAISTMMGEGRAMDTDAQALLSIPLANDGDERTLRDYWQDEDWDALADAFDNPNQSFIYYGGGKNGTAKNAVAKMFMKLFPDAENISDGSSMASYLKGLKSTYGSMADQSGDDMGEEAAKSLTEVGYSVSNITGDAIDNAPLIKNALNGYKGEDGASAEDVKNNSTLYEDIMKSTGQNMSGYLSNDVLATMSAEQAESYAESVYEEFLNEDDDTKSKGLQAYIESDHGKEEITNIVNKYAQVNKDGDVSEQTRQQVLVEIGFKDGADEILYGKWKQSNNEENRTNGTGS